jgi:hypothetical protein
MAALDAISKLVDDNQNQFICVVHLRAKMWTAKEPSYL